MLSCKSNNLQSYIRSALSCPSFPSSLSLAGPRKLEKGLHSRRVCDHTGLARGRRLHGFATKGPHETDTDTQAVPLSELRELVKLSLLGLSYSGDEADIIGDVSPSLSEHV